MNEKGGNRQRSSPPNQTTAGKVNRRGLLRVLGLGAFGLLPLPVLPRVLQAALRGVPATRADAAAARSPDGRIRQWTMIIDLRYCDGCQSVGKPPQCTAACIEGHFAPEPMEWIQVFEAELHGEGTQFIPTPCQQCQNPPCVNVCPVAATFSTPEGTVLIDQNRCIGCRICMAACPYDRRFFNWDDPVQPGFVTESPYDPETQVPAVRGTVMKCDFCPEMTRRGGLPWCVTACPNGAIYIGDLEEDVATNGAQVFRFSQLINEEGAYQPKAELGTKPRLFYIEGHGELARTESDNTELLTDRLEWPWQDMAAAGGEGAGHG
jgi:Fe-S-cluster-containing dehydrogenase component